MFRRRRTRRTRRRARRRRRERWNRRSGGVYSRCCIASGSILYLLT
jgi:hypothetical protein